MALNIGGVNFNVDANTAGLQKAITALNQFHNQVNKTAKSQQAGAAATASALSRQESAIKRAFQQTLNLQRAQRDAGQNASQVGIVTRAFSRLTQEMTSGKLTTIEYTRALDAFNTRMGRSRRALLDFKAAQAAAKDNNSFTAFLRNMESSAVFAIGPLSGVGSRIRAMGSIAGRSGLLITGFAAGVAGAAVGVGILGREAIRAGRLMEQTQARFAAAAGSSVQGAKELEFVVEVSKRLGLRIEDTAVSYSRLTAAAAGTALEGEETRKIFEGISNAAAALRQGNLEVEGSFRAIEQMISKGKVQAEELRGQLGERLPGAFRKAADAMGVTTSELDKMLKNGEVLSDDFLPKFAKLLTDIFGEAAKANVKSYQGSLNNLSNSWLLFADRINTVFNLTGNLATVFRGISSVLDTVTDTLTENGDAWAFAVDAANSAMMPNLLKLLLAGSRDAAREVAASAEVVKMLDKEIKNLTLTIPEFSDGFKTSGNNIEEMSQKMLLLQKVMSNKGEANGRTPEQFKDFMEMIESVKTAVPADMERLAKTLSNVLNIPVKPNLDSISSAMLFLTTQTNQAQKAFDDWSDSFTDTSVADNLHDLNLEITDMRDRFAVLSKGESATKFFDQVTAKVTDARRAMEGISKGGLNTEQLNALKLYEEGLRRAFVASQRNVKGIAATNEQLREMRLRLQAMQGGSEAAEVFDKITSKVLDFESGLKDLGLTTAETSALVQEFSNLLNEMNKIEGLGEMLEVMNEASQTISDARLELQVLSGSTQEQEYFRAVTSEVNKFQQGLVGSGVALVDIIRLSNEYKDVLDETFQKTKNLELATGFAETIGDGLLDIITGARNAKDAIKDLTKALIEMAIRKLIIDNLVGALGGVFARGMNSLGNTGGSPQAGKGLGSDPSTGAPLLRAAHGGSMSVGGFGGTDSQLVSFMATPGEKVDITPLGKSGGGGGGTVVQIIDQRGANADQVEVSRSQTGGLEMIKVLIRGEIANEFSSGRVDRLFAANNMPVRRTGAR